MAMSATLKVACTVVLMCMMVACPHVDATITCIEVTALLSPCINYGINGGAVPPECCVGVKGIHVASKTTEDRRTACSCIQAGAALIPGINYDLINSLPTQCGVNCNYTVYPSTDCSRVS
ncbi:hypothetical protein L1049_013844 [Liquidambar formosana]|uniref:Non-specific lipid-transfer protein n=1 Tax=Liquidambar formosana TaxID=63359 RepID=A0AAP0RPI2_LIQFO